MKQIYLFGMYLLAACSIVPSCGAQTAPESTPAAIVNTAIVPTLRVDRHEDMQRKLDRFAGRHFDLVFDGDSITNRWETTGAKIWKQRYMGIAADFGIEGDRVENVLWRLSHGQADGIDPKVVVLMIGTNNSGRNSASQIAEGIKELVDEYEKCCPQAHIILMGILPRGETLDDAGRRKITAVNSEIELLDDGQRVTYIDIGAQLIEPNGTISREVMPDFVHPTVRGYQIWVNAIQSVIHKYISSKN